MTKSTKVLIIVLAAVLLIAVLFCCAASAFAYLNTQKIMTALDESGEEEPTREDDVCIAEEYYIRSTTPISDAYTSGDVSALDDRQKEVLKMAETVIKEVIEDDMTPYEKEEAVYRWLTSELKSETGMLTVIPDSGEDSDNPYGVLKYHTAVCVGYATTFRMFMHMLGIECMVVHDTSLTHSWDLVKLDGDWYHVDCYFDSDQSNYRHFNLSDAIMIEDHDWDRSFFPKAEGYKYNAAAQNAETVKSVTTSPRLSRQSWTTARPRLPAASRAASPPPSSPPQAISQTPCPIRSCLLMKTVSSSFTGPIWAMTISCCVCSSMITAKTLRIFPRT